MKGRGRRTADHREPYVLSSGAASLRNDRRTRSHVGARVTAIFSAYFIPETFVPFLSSRTILSIRVSNRQHNVLTASGWKKEERRRERGREREKRTAEETYCATSWRRISGASDFPYSPSMEKDDYESLPTNSVAVHMTAGALAGIMEHCVMYPFDSVKV